MDILSVYQIEQDKAKKTNILINSYNLLRLAKLSNTRTNQQAYQTLVRKLLYLLILTRLDISFALRRLSQYLLDPAEFYIIALRKVLKYLQLTLDYRITFSRKNPKGLISYSNSNFASNCTNRMSILGNMFMLRGRLISQASKKQKLVATLTIDAKYIAMCKASKQL